MCWLFKCATKKRITKRSVSKYSLESDGESIPKPFLSPFLMSACFFHLSLLNSDFCFPCIVVVFICFAWNLLSPAILCSGAFVVFPCDVVGLRRLPMLHNAFWSSTDFARRLGFIVLLLLCSDFGLNLISLFSMILDGWPVRTVCIFLIEAVGVHVSLDFNPTRPGD